MSINSIATAAACHSSIAGGQNNQIPSGNFSVIMGGDNNIITGNHNAILGGRDNNDNGFNCVGIFGDTIGAVMNNAFHARTYVAQNMPLLPFATRQLYCRFNGTANEVFIC